MLACSSTLILVVYILSVLQYPKGKEEEKEEEEEEELCGCALAL
jgi:hypothetical protein